MVFNNLINYFDLMEIGKHSPIILHLYNLLIKVIYDRDKPMESPEPSPSADSPSLADSEAHHKQLTCQST